MTLETRSEPGIPGVTASVAELVAFGRATPPPAEPPRPGALKALAGPYLSAFRGGGVEFDEVRAYQAGDDVRGIDWRVTARTGRPHSRVFREDHERPVWLLVDLGADMHFGTRRAFKSLVAARSAALLAAWAREAGDRVGGLVRGAEACLPQAPSGGEAGFFHLLEAIARGTRPGAGGGGVSLDEAIGRIAEAAGSGSRVTVLSDFASLGTVGRRHLGALARRCELTCVWIYDPLEEQAPPAGEYAVSDGELVHAVSIGGRAARDAYRKAFAERSESLAAFCRGRRIQLVALRSDDDPRSVLPRAAALRSTVR